MNKTNALNLTLPDPFYGQSTYAKSNSCYKQSEANEFGDYIQAVSPSVQNGVQSMSTVKYRPVSELKEMDDADYLHVHTQVGDYSDDWYMMFSGDGIVCLKKGQENNRGIQYEDDRMMWAIPFDSPEQLTKVETFLDDFPEPEKLLFTTREVFWEDFLSDSIDMDGFMEYYDWTDDGTPIWKDSYANFHELKQTRIRDNPYFKYFWIPTSIKDYDPKDEDKFVDGIMVYAKSIQEKARLSGEKGSYKPECISGLCKYFPQDIKRLFGNSWYYHLIDGMLEASGLGRITSTPEALMSL